jgi:hypothetical protein
MRARWLLAGHAAAAGDHGAHGWPAGPGRRCAPLGQLGRFRQNARGLLPTSPVQLSGGSPCRSPALPLLPLREAAATHTFVSPPVHDLL